MASREREIDSEDEIQSCFSFLTHIPDKSTSFANFFIMLANQGHETNNSPQCIEYKSVEMKNIVRSRENQGGLYVYVRYVKLFIRAKENIWT